MLELISFAVFAITIVGLYLLFYPTNSPLHEMAVVYLPPIFIIRLVFSVERRVLAENTTHADSPSELPCSRNIFERIYGLYHYQPFHF